MTLRQILNRCEFYEVSQLERLPMLVLPWDSTIAAARVKPAKRLSMNRAAPQTAVRQVQRPQWVIQSCVIRPMSSLYSTERCVRSPMSSLYNTDSCDISPMSSFSINHNTNFFLLMNNGSTFIILMYVLKGYLVIMIFLKWTMILPLYLWVYTFIWRRESLSMEPYWMAMLH